MVRPITSSASETVETETSHSLIIREPVTLFRTSEPGAIDVTILDSTVSAVLGETWEPEHEFSMPPVLHPFYSSPPLARQRTLFRTKPLQHPYQANFLHLPAAAPQVDPHSTTADSLNKKPNLFTR